MHPTTDRKNHTCPRAHMCGTTIKPQRFRFRQSTRSLCSLFYARDSWLHSLSTTGSASTDAHTYQVKPSAVGQYAKKRDGKKHSLHKTRLPLYHHCQTQQSAARHTTNTLSTKQTTHSMKDPSALASSAHTHTHTGTSSTQSLRSNAPRPNAIWQCRRNQSEHSTWFCQHGCFVQALRLFFLRRFCDSDRC